MLADAGVEVQVEPAEIDEAAIKLGFRAAGRSAVDCALALAEAKAGWVARVRKRDLVVGADQILVCADQWFDKPTDLTAARAQLKFLRGRVHELVTAACVVQHDTRLWRTVSRPSLRMRNFSDGFLDGYLAVERAAILGSVGAYRIEGKGVQLFDRVEGDHFAILGMPLLELLAFLRNRGVLRS